MIKQPTIHRRTSVATVVGILSVLYASTFLVGALLHLGWRIPLGFTLLAEPKILPATLVEGLCGLGRCHCRVHRHALGLDGCLRGPLLLLWRCSARHGRAGRRGRSDHGTERYLPPRHAGCARGGHGTAAFTHWEDRTPSGRMTDSNTITLNTWTSARGLRSRV
jgi:hypothetical protein